MRSTARIGSHPIHPMLVAFPLALFITALIFDLIAAQQQSPALAAAAWYAIVAGIVGAVLAVAPGAIDLFTVVPPRSSGRNRGLLHGGLNVVMLGLFVAVAVYRGGPNVMPNGAALIMELIGVGVLGISGWLGGTLVYRNQIGVDHRYAKAGQYQVRELDSWDKPVCNPSELADGQMLLAKIAGERVVIGRCPEGIAAFSDHCTHKGGPLSDGALVGCTVQCPWHGSQFDVHTGRVVSGPAKNKIETYETEIRAGEVYVLPKGAREKKAA